MLGVNPNTDISSKWAGCVCETWKRDRGDAVNPATRPVKLQIPDPCRAVHGTGTRRVRLVSQPGG